MNQFNRSKTILLFWVLYILCSPLVSGGHYSSEDESSEEINESCKRLPPNPPRSPVSSERNVTITGLLNDAYNHLVNPGSHQDVILILGNTGVGKTTLTQIIAGDLHRIHAVLTDAEDIVIIDDDERISAPAVISRTLVPELVVKTEEDGNSTTAFYDCPGFDDTRGPVQDIAANFFLNEIVRGTNRVKMLFLVSYSHIQVTHDRGINFVKLVKHATEFVKSMNKFNNSIALVVTNVKSFSYNGKYIKDKDIMKEIVNFLKLCKHTFQDSLQTVDNNEKKNEIKRKIEFLNILLEKNSQNEYSQIGFSRNPSECGPLNGSDEAKDTRERVTNLYHNLDFGEVGNVTDNFGFTLSTETIGNIGNYSDQVNNEIAESVAYLVNEFKNWVDKIELPRAKNVRELSNWTLTTASIISGMNFTTKFSSPVDLENYIRGQLTTVGFQVASNSTFRKQEKILSFFEMVAGPGVVKRDSLVWVEPCRQLAVEMEKYKNWYGFCRDIEHILKTYSFQSKSLLAPHGNSVDWLNFIKTKNIKNVGVVAKLGTEFTPDSRQKQVLNDIMRYGLSPVKYSCDNRKGEMYVVGHFVRLSEFIGENEEVKSEKRCNGNSKGLSIFVYASHTIFIDSNLNGIGKSYSLVLISPNWEVVGRQYLNLNGATARGAYPEKAHNGRNNEWGGYIDGKDGQAGSPGGPGGHFFGVAGQIINAGGLTVIVDGGNGGSGQNGGDGGNGMNGRAARREDAYEMNSYNHYVVYRKWRQHLGFPGQNGGNGGNGGMGGSGGKHGHISIVSGDGSAIRIKRSLRDGTAGRPGVGGRGGKGGQAGDRIHCDHHRILGFTRKDQCTNYKSWEADAPNGRNGDSPIYRKDMTSTIRNRYPISESSCIVTYKNLFFNDLHDDTVKFIQYLNGDDQVRRFG